MLQEDRDRLTRVETKLDLVLPHIKMVTDHDKDISFAKWSLRGLWAIIVTGLGIYFGNKH